MRTFKDLLKARWQTLDQFPAYLRAVKTEAWNIAWGDGVLAIVFVLYWSVAPISERTIALYFVGAVVIAGYYIWRADHLRLIPKITLRFENGPPFKQPTPMEDVLGVRIFFRVFPDCSSPVPNCTGHLLAVYREIDGHWKPTLFNEAVLLTWADGRVGPITVEPRIGPYLNVFCTDSDEKEIMPCLARPMLRTSAMFRKLSEEKHATFRFDIEVTNGAPISLKVRMDDRPSYWDRPLIEVLPYDENSSN